MPKINNETDLQYKRRVIDIKSDSFCAAKWYNATIWLGSGMTTSCHHPLPHKVSLEDIAANPKALHNSIRKKEERAMMQRGDRPEGCSYCWKIEDMGTSAVSDRVYKTVIYNDEDLDYAYNLPSDEDVDLQTLEISFDRTCQFACSYCNPAFSSTWVRDIKSNGAYTNLVSDGRNHFTHVHDSSQLYTLNEVNPYVEAFFKWWETDLHRTLKELRITGGEPLMSGYTWRLIDWFKEHRGESKTRLAINSNLGFKRDVLDRLLDSTQGIELDIYTSNESMDTQAEYIRDGLDWQQWNENLVFLIESKQVRCVHIMGTINALCLPSLTEFLTSIVTLKEKYGRDALSFTLNIVRFPSFQSPLVLPVTHRNRYSSELSEFLLINKDHVGLHEHEREHVKRLVDYLNQEVAPDTKLLLDFKQFYQQYDQRRGKDFKYTFTQLTDWYNTL
jgi:pyruvate-formate lyase-activating enzyme